MTNFNPRTRVGCDCLRRRSDANLDYFNPRTRVGCDGVQNLEGFLLHHFNPRTRVGCDQPDLDPRFIRIISIHAPAWGATFKRQDEPRAETISIHAPAWGATG